MTTSYRPPPTALAPESGPARARPTSTARPEARTRGVARTRWYVRERWLVGLLGAVVPMGIALMLPLPLRPLLVWPSLAVGAAGLVMLARRAGGSTADDWYDGWEADTPSPLAGPAVADARATDPRPGAAAGAEATPRRLTPTAAR